jgi:hypothetical protein
VQNGEDILGVEKPERIGEIRAVIERDSRDDVVIRLLVVAYVLRFVDGYVDDMRHAVFDIECVIQCGGRLFLDEVLFNQLVPGLLQDQRALLLQLAAFELEFLCFLDLGPQLLQERVLPRIK